MCLPVYEEKLCDECLEMFRGLNITSKKRHLRGEVYCSEECRLKAEGEIMCPECEKQLKEKDREIRKLRKLLKKATNGICDALLEERFKYTHEWSRLRGVYQHLKDKENG